MQVSNSNQDQAKLIYMTIILMTFVTNQARGVDKASNKSDFFRGGGGHKTFLGAYPLNTPFAHLCYVLLLRP